MRAVLGVCAALLIGTEANAECVQQSDVKGWMRLEWWGSTVTEFNAGPDTAAIVDGIRQITGRRFTPEMRIVAFLSRDGKTMRLTLFPTGCYAGYIDVEPKRFFQWLERSKL